MIAEAKDVKALGFDDLGARRVSSLSFIGEMLSAVEFDHEACGVTYEIGDIALNWHLSSKTSSLKAMIAQFRPKEPFSVRRILAE
jgi:hypothetical protein